METFVSVENSNKLQFPIWFCRLSEEKRRYLWFYRFYCNNENCSLPLVLGSAPGWDEKTISEIHIILRRWKFSHPLEALGLLTSR